MITFLMTILGAVGATHILIDGRIFETLRNKVLKSESTKKYCPFVVDWITCHQCGGFWVGLIFAILNLYTLNPITLVLVGSAVSLLSMMSKALLSYWEMNLVVDLNDIPQGQINEETETAGN